jgi:nuclear pore complex protein Nup133
VIHRREVQKNEGGGSLAWLPSDISSEAADRKFSLTNHGIQCWSISLLHGNNVKKTAFQEIVGSDGEMGIQKGIAGQKNIWTCR